MGQRSVEVEKESEMDELRKYYLIAYNTRKGIYTPIGGLGDVEGYFETRDIDEIINHWSLSSWDHGEIFSIEDERIIVHAFTSHDEESDDYGTWIKCHKSLNRYVDARELG